MIPALSRLLELARKATPKVQPYDFEAVGAIREMQRALSPELVAALSKLAIAECRFLEEDGSMNEIHEALDELLRAVGGET